MCVRIISVDYSVALCKKIVVLVFPVLFYQKSVVDMYCYLTCPLPSPFMGMTSTYNFNTSSLWNHWVTYLVFFFREELKFCFWTYMFMNSLLSFKISVYLFSFPHVYVANMRLCGLQIEPCFWSYM